MHRFLILYDKISNIDKIFVLLEPRYMDRELHEKEKIILYLRIESENIIERTIFLYHRLCMEVDDMPKGFFFVYIGTHYLDKCRDFPNFLEKESYQWPLELSYIPTESEVYTQRKEEENEDE